MTLRAVKIFFASMDDFLRRTDLAATDRARWRPTDARCLLVSSPAPPLGK